MAEIIESIERGKPAANSRRRGGHVAAKWRLKGAVEVNAQSRKRGLGAIFLRAYRLRVSSSRRRAFYNGKYENREEL